MSSQNWSLGSLLQIVEGSFRVGERVGPYELLEVVGSGGAGKVYRARDPAGREVAVKLSHSRLSGGGLRRFEREGQLLARLESPGVVRIHAAGLWRERPFLVMELVEGRPCREVLTSAPREQRVRLVLAIAEALVVLHEAGIVHRDLKPENVLVDSQGAPKITDLGLARGEELDPLTRSGTLLGTPLYMAPEQVNAPRTGPPADVWALGVMLYEALTGEHPIEAGPLDRVLAQVLGKEIPAPRTLDATVPPELSAVCERALERDLARRFPDAGAFAAALRSALEPSAPRPATPPWLLAAAGLLLLASLLWAFSVAPAADAHISPAPAEADPAALGPADPTQPIEATGDAQPAASGPRAAAARVDAFVAALPPLPEEAPVDLAPDLQQSWRDTALVPHLAVGFIETLRAREERTLSLSWIKECLARPERSIYLKAWINLGDLYERGEGVPLDPEAAEVCYRRVLAAGQSVGAARLASHYRSLGKPSEAILDICWQGVRLPDDQIHSAARCAERLAQAACEEPPGADAGSVLEIATRLLRSGSDHPNQTGLCYYTAQLLLRRGQVEDRPEILEYLRAAGAATDSQGQAARQLLERIEREGWPKHP